MLQTNAPIPIDSDLPTTIPNVDRVPEFIKFAMWHATPYDFRRPKTQKEFAELIGVCEDTLTDWKKNPYFFPVMQHFLGQWFKEKIPDALLGLYHRVRYKGTAKEVELFLRLAGIDVNQTNKKPKK